MIKVIFHEGKFIPLVLCDICDRQITDATQAIVVSYFLRTFQDDWKVFYVHKGKCSDVAATRFNEPATWEKLSTHLYLLCHNLGLTSEWFQEHDKNFKGFL